MPPFFDVPGWTVPNEPISASKKRKRPRASAANGTDDADQIASASINVDKLIRSLDTVLAAEGKAGKIKGKIPAVLLGDDEDMPEGSRAGKRNKVDEGKKGKVNKPSDEISSQKMKAHAPTTGKGKTKEATTPGASHQDRSADAATAPASRKKKKEKANTNNPETSTKAAQPSAVSKPDTGSSQMTALQAKMKNSLDGARFRWINEELYKSDSTHALSMMRQDPDMFNEYHTGFRHQVQSWPTNPVEHYITRLSSYPTKTVIADLGCGDATLAKALIPKDMVVLSYDLSSDDAYVTEADVCTNIPLPGAEPEAGTEGPGHGHVVDVVVCALSLMGTNWPGTIRQAWRILRLGGELKIAEVASRFTDVDTFVSLVAKLGFRLATKDASNSHFTLFEFRKTARKALSKKEWANLLAKGETLKPCEYKRR